MLALELLCVLAGAAMQGVTGFGFALFAAPLLGAFAGPKAAVSDLAVLGLLLNAGVLARATDVQRQELSALLRWALPGVIVGVAVLGTVPRRPVLAVVGVVAIAGAVMIGRGLRGGNAPLSGAAAGVLTTLTGVNGPPLVVYLLARDTEKTALRDTLAALFCALDGAGIVVLLISGEWDAGPELLALGGAAAIGLLAGRGLHDRLSGTAFTRLTLGLLVASGLTALAHAAI